MSTYMLLVAMGAPKLAELSKANFVRKGEWFANKARTLSCFGVQVGGLLADSGAWIRSAMKRLRKPLRALKPAYSGTDGIPTALSVDMNSFSQ